MSDYQQEQAEKQRIKPMIVSLIHTYHDKYDAFTEQRSQLAAKVLEAYDSRDSRYLHRCKFNQIAEEGANDAADRYYNENVTKLREILSDWDGARLFNIKHAVKFARESLKIIEGRQQRLECATSAVDQVLEKAPKSAGYQARLDKRPRMEIADPAIETYEIVDTPAGYYDNKKGRNGRPVLSARR